MSSYFKSVTSNPPMLVFISGIVTVGLAPERYSLGLIAFWTLVALAYAARRRWQIRCVKEIFRGEVLGYFHAPFPMDSLVSSLEANGIRLSDIQFMWLMSADT